MQPGRSEKGHRRGLESHGQIGCGHTQKDISIRTQSVWEKQSENCLQKHWCCLTRTYFQGDTNLPDGISSCQKHTEGVTGVAALQLERSPGWVPVPAFPAPGAPREMHFKMMHFTSTSSKGTFLLAALPERNCVSPGRFWGSNPYPSPPFPLPALPLQSSNSPRRDLDCLCFPMLGVSFLPWEHHCPRKSTFQRAFLLLCISLGTEIHLVRNMQF